MPRARLGAIRPARQYPFRDDPRGLADCPSGIDLLVVSVTSAENLLAAMVAVRHLAAQRSRNARLPGGPRLREFLVAAAFGPSRRGRDLADVLRYDHRPAGRPRRGAARAGRCLAAGQLPRGVLGAAIWSTATGNCRVRACRRPRPPSPPKRCFGRASSAPLLLEPLRQFCVQNDKHNDPRPPSPDEVPAALDRIEAQIAAGYRTFIFSDEALAPALLRRFCQGVLDRGLRFRWSSRCRMEPNVDRELLSLMRKAGCFEVLYGLESSSPHMQERCASAPRGCRPTGCATSCRP